MDKKATIFSVDSNGYCFICLHKISSWPHSPLSVNPSSVYSFQDISRYVKLDMRKVFIDQGPVAPHLLDKVKKSTLKVQLCEKCASITENISRQCRELEKLKMEIESGLESIHVKRSDADQTGRTERFRKTASSTLDRGMIGGCIEVLEVLRLERMQKCSYLKSAATPRLKIQRLSRRKIRRETFRNPREEAVTSSERGSDLGLQRNGIEVEGPSCGSWGVDEDNDSYNSFDNDLNNDVEDSVIVKSVVEPSHSRMINGKSMRNREVTTGDNPQRKWVMNNKTRKYKCKLCSKEYGSIPNVYHHYDAVHRRVRFTKCKICGKDFSKKDSYNVHHQRVHLGVRFQCKVCNKMFSSKGYLLTHQRKEGCEIGQKAE